MGDEPDFGTVAHERERAVTRLDVAIAELNGEIAIGLGCLDLCDSARAGLYDGDGHDIALLVVDRVMPIFVPSSAGVISIFRSFSSVGRGGQGPPAKRRDESTSPIRVPNGLLRGVLG